MNKLLAALLAGVFSLVTMTAFAADVESTAAAAEAPKAEAPVKHKKHHHHAKKKAAMATEAAPVEEAK